MTDNPKVPQQTTMRDGYLWKIVPYRLTNAMRDAFWRHMTTDIENGKASAADECWAALLDASPRTKNHGE